MSNFNVQITNKGQALLTKALAGKPLVFTRMAIGSGSITNQSIPTMTGLIDRKLWVALNRSRVVSVGEHLVGGSFNNSVIATGFFFRELGLFAQDPDEGEILYSYGNAGNGAEFIPAGGSSSVVEKQVDIISTIGSATNVTATINESLVFPTKAEYEAHKEASVLDHPDGSVTTEKLANGAANDDKIGNRNISDTAVPTGNAGKLTTLLGWLAHMIKSITGKSNWRTAPAITLEATKTHIDDNSIHTSTSERNVWNAKETPTGAQAKVDTHANKKDNPHAVTKSQIGLGNVDNVKQATKEEFDTHALSVATKLAETVKNKVPTGSIINNDFDFMTEHTRIDIYANSAINHEPINLTNGRRFTLEVLNLSPYDGSTLVQKVTYTTPNLGSFIRVCSGGVYSSWDKTITNANSPDILPVTGSYGGDGTTNRKINLGFTPTRVIVMLGYGTSIVTHGVPTTNGFVVNNQGATPDSIGQNATGNGYNYIAFRN